LTLGLANAAAATLLALFVTGAGRILLRRPAVLHCLWLLVLLKLVTPPLFEVPVPGQRFLRSMPDGQDRGLVTTDAGDQDVATAEWAEEEDPTAVDAETVSATGSVSEEPGFAAIAPRWPNAVVWLAGLWLAGTAATLLLAGVRIIRFGLVLRAASPVDEQVSEEVEELAARLDLQRAPTAWWIDANMTPMLWAVGCRPRLIIPRDLWKSLDSRQRSMLLLHELAHLRRGDHVVRLLELLVTALYWWLPVVWWGRRALRNAEEQCCDAWVVWAFPDETRAYAETLLETVDFLNPSRSPEPLLASGFGGAQHLRRRLTMIMLGTTPRRLGWPGGLGAFALSALLLPLTPSWAQKPGETQKETQSVVVVEVKDDQAQKPAEGVKEEIDLILTADGTQDKIKADSIKKASEILKQRIDALVQDKAGSEDHAAQIKALKQAMAELQKVRTATFDFKVATPDGKTKTEQRRVVIRRLDGELDAKVLGERKADIAKAKARVDAARKALAEKRTELASAERDLAKLSAEMVRARVGAKLAIPDGKVEKEAAKVEKQSITLIEKLPPRQLSVRLADPARQAKVDSERLDLLEKQLSKILDEVKSLKESRDESRAKGK
jgi:beta-lactamase regulating signal transducer with metallopeptidase domain